MKLRNISIALVILIAAVAGLFFFLKGKHLTIAIPQSAIDSALAERFPDSKTYLLVFTITYSNPEVTLLEGENRVQVGLDATLKFKLNDDPLELTGGATVISGIRYEAENHAIYLDDAKFDRLEIEGIPEKYLDKVTEIATIAAREFIESRPIYRLEAKDAKTAAAKMLLKDFKVKDQAVHVSLGI